MSNTLNNLIEAATNLRDLHLAEQEGLLSGKPTRQQWLEAVDKLSDALAKVGDDAGTEIIGKWRIVLVNATLPDSAFYTIQKADYSVFDYSHELSSYVETLVKKYEIVLTAGQIGDAYSEWQYLPLKIPKPPKNQ